MGHLIYAIEHKESVLQLLQEYNKSMGSKFPLQQSHFDQAIFRQLKEEDMVAVIKAGVKLSEDVQKKVTTGIVIKVNISSYTHIRCM